MSLPECYQNEEGGGKPSKHSSLVLKNIVTGTLDGIISLR